MPINPQIPLQVRTPQMSLQPLMDGLAFRQQRAAQQQQMQAQQQQMQQRRIAMAKQQKMKDIFSASAKLAPGGKKTLDRQALVQNLYQAGMGQEAMRFQQKFAQEASKKRTDFLNNQKILQTAKQDIIKTSMPYMSAMTDTAERGRIFKDSHTEWGLPTDSLPTDITDDMLAQWQQQALGAAPQGGQFLNTTEGILFGDKGQGTVSPVNDPISGKRAMTAFSPKPGKVITTAGSQKLVSPLTGATIKEFAETPEITLKRSENRRQNAELGIKQAQLLMAQTKEGIANDKARLGMQGITPELRVKARAKSVILATARKQIANVRKAFENIKGTFSAGPYADMYTNTPAGKAFDKAIASLAATYRALTRTPGEGSMSDMETKLALGGLPDRGIYESVTEQQIIQIEEMVALLSDGYASFLGPVKQPINATPMAAPKGLTPSKQSRLEALERKLAAEGAE